MHVVQFARALLLISARTDRAMGLDGRRAARRSAAAVARWPARPDELWAEEGSTDATG